MLTVLVLIWVIAAGLFAWLGLGRPWRGRGALLVVFLAATLASGAIVMDGLWGACKPQSMVWRSGSTELVAYDWLEGKTMWLWVRWPDDPAPVCYTVPWSEETASGIEEAEQDGDEGTIIVDWGEPIEEGGEDEFSDRWLPPAWFRIDEELPPNVHAEPQRPDPPKVRRSPAWQLEIN